MYERGPALGRAPFCCVKILRRAEKRDVPDGQMRVEQGGGPVRPSCNARTTYRVVLFRAGESTARPQINQTPDRAACGIRSPGTDDMQRGAKRSAIS